MKKILPILLVLVMLLSFPMSAMGLSLLPEGYFPLDIPMFEYIASEAQPSFTLNNLAFSAQGSSEELEVYRADTGNNITVYFSIHEDSGYIKSIMITQPTSTTLTNDDAGFEFFTNVGVLCGLGQNFGNADIATEEFVGILGYERNFTASDITPRDITKTIGNITYSHVVTNSLISFGVSANPYTVEETASGTPAGTGERAVTLIVDGETLTLDTAPKLVNGRVLIPVRGVFEKLGATVDWNEAQQKATIVKDGITVELTINSADAYINGQISTLDVPATVYDYRTYAPLRFVSEAINADVDWQEASYTVVITSGEK